MRRVSTDSNIVAVDRLGRLCLPSGIRSRFAPRLTAETLFVTIHDRERILLFSSLEAINAHAAGLARDLGMIEADVRDLFHLQATSVVLDPRGRLVLPEKYRQAGGLSSTARVTEYGEYLAIDDPARIVERVERLNAAMAIARRAKNAR